MIRSLNLIHYEIIVGGRIMLSYCVTCTAEHSEAGKSLSSRLDLSTNFICFKLHYSASGMFITMKIVTLILHH